MPQIFINFRSCDSIFDCMLYSKELAPVLLDEGDKIVKLLFLADKFDLNLNDLTCSTSEFKQEIIKQNTHSQPGQKREHHRGIYGKPELDLQQTFHENVIAQNGFVQKPWPASSNSNVSQTESQETKEILTFCVVPYSMCVILMDAHLASCTACEINRSRKFRRRFLKYLRRMHGFKNCVYDDIDFSQLLYDDFLAIGYMVDVVTVWPRQRLDYKWGVRVCDLVIKKMLLEEAMAWLSTLGGGYSALGDYDLAHAYTACSVKIAWKQVLHGPMRSLRYKRRKPMAVTAGEVSLKQMKIAVELGDPIMAAKCRLFWAQSRMQLGYLKECKKIVRFQFQYAKYANFQDDRLFNMIHGIWSRLQYVYQCRHHLHQKHGHNTHSEQCKQTDDSAPSNFTNHARKSETVKVIPQN